MKIVKRLAICCLALGLYLVRYSQALPHIDEHYAGFYLNRFVHVHAIISDAPIEAAFQKKIKLTVKKLYQNGVWQAASGTVLADVPSWFFGEYGDRVEASGFLQKSFRPHPAIAGVMKKPEIRIIGKNGGNFIKRIFLNYRKHIHGKFQENFPEPFASLAEALLIGERAAIPQSIVDDFRQAGLSHILALSGFNVVIIIASITALFAFLPRRIGAAVCILFILFFVLLAGAGASIVRAAIMGSLGLIARMAGRPNQGLRSLFLSAYAMIIADPFLLIYDIGFQLSCAATAGLILFGGKSVLATTLAAQAFTLPLILFYFKSLSLVAPFANVVILPFIPLLMLGCGLSLVFGKIIAAPTYLLFRIVLFLIHLFASIPFSFVSF